MHRGHAWLINLDPTLGAEIKKTRPAMIVPITDWKDHYNIAPWMVRLDPDAENGLNKSSAADVFQVRSVSQQRFVRQLGTLSDPTMRRITQALAIVLNIEL